MPFNQVCATSLEYSIGSLPFEVASSLIHPSKLAGLNVLSIRHKFPISPFGSIMMDGILSKAASSINPTPNPVLPDPVIPMIVACVVNALFLISVNSLFDSSVVLSKSLPK